jgi:hypothetical protein
VGKVTGIALAVAFCVGCGSKQATPPDNGGNPNTGVDAGKPDPGPPDAGPPDSGTPDAGTPDAGTPDAGTPDAGPKFGGPGPWPMTNQIYGAADGIVEQPVVGVSTDETQNLWVATNQALYVMRPGETKFHRFDASSGSTTVESNGVEHRLHLPGNVAASCPDPSGTFTPCLHGDADSPGISEIAGGGMNEVFVGYYGHHDWNDPNDGTNLDIWRHSGKLDRVQLKGDGTLDVVRFDMVSSDTTQFWHNHSVERMIYDHFKHPHELYVGTDHGVDKFSPDKWHPPVGWFNSPQNNLQWMSDHLHPRACYHAVCAGDANQRLGDWRGLALDSGGDLWVGGRWAAGAITYLADNTNWYNNPRDPVTKASAFKQAFGDPYYGNCSGERPVFCTPQEGDFVNLTAVTVTKDPKTGQDKVWYSSGVIYNDPADVNYGVAAFLAHPGPGDQVWTYFDPIRDIGMAEVNVRDMVALPDGRIVFAGPNTGLAIWDPVAKTHVSIRAGQGIPSDNVLRLDLDTMVNPPALHVATYGGAAVLRVLP